MTIVYVAYIYELRIKKKSSGLGDQYINSNGEYAIHLFLNNGGVFQNGKSYYPIRRNRLYLTKPGESYAILPDDKNSPVSLYTLLFTLDNTNEEDRPIISLLEANAEQGRLIDPKNIFLVTALFHIDKIKDPGWVAAAKYQLMALLYLWFSNPWFASPEEAKSGLTAKYQIEQALQIMNETLNKPININGLAAQVGLGEEYFIRLFKKEIGISPLQYFNRIRISAAAARIINTTLTIEKIAGSFGFESPYYFSRVFKQITGYTPSHYRHIFASPNIRAKDPHRFEE
jgi:AraC-like DNA-binding protein